MSQLSLMGLNKNIRLINFRIGKGHKVEAFKQFLRNKVNKANIERNKTKRKQRRVPGLIPQDGNLWVVIKN